MARCATLCVNETAPAHGAAVRALAGPLVPAGARGYIVTSRITPPHFNPITRHHGTSSQINELLYAIGAEHVLVARDLTSIY